VSAPQRLSDIGCSIRSRGDKWIETESRIWSRWAACQMDPAELLDCLFARQRSLGWAGAHFEFPAWSGWWVAVGSATIRKPRTILRAAFACLINSFKYGTHYSLQRLWSLLPQSFVLGPRMFCLSDWQSSKAAKSIAAESLARWIGSSDRSVSIRSSSRTERSLYRL